MKIHLDYPVSILDSKLFTGLTDAQMKLLIKEASLKKYPLGEIILKEGEDGTDFYWISSGRVEIQMASSTAGGPPLQLTVLTSGDVFGEMALLGFTKRAATAIVRAEASIYTWNLEKTLNLFIDQPAIGYRVTRNLGHMLGERLINTNKQLRGRTEAMDAALAKNLV